ncbi:HigA family addiction module antitoxin [Paraburkholderia strydomiana]|uniref:HigA family addiction module antitoxin n=1 Tax=Paraburkholderia strydomiana TaxID=1245417 RepID=UPI0038B7C211
MKVIYEGRHPGEQVRPRMEALKLSVTATAQALGVTRKCLSELLNGRFGVSPEMALRLAAGFPDTTPEFWLDLQMRWDLQVARNKLGTLEIKPLTENSRHA